LQSALEDTRVNLLTAPTKAQIKQRENKFEEEIVQAKKMLSDLKARLGEDHPLLSTVTE
jgi:hypothetical protein